MEEDAGFEQVGATGRRLHGPRGLIVSGIPAEEQDSILGLVDGLVASQEGDVELPLIFVTDEEAELTLLELLEKPSGHNVGSSSGLQRAIIMSGLAELELHVFMRAYRQLGLDRPLWATLTPTSETWSLAHLLSELIAEDESFSS